MIKLVYRVSHEQKEKEIEWLKLQKVYPAVSTHYDWVKMVSMINIGVIVSEETALAIKLRHKILIQDEYRQR